MKTTQKIAAIVLVLLLGAVAYGLFRTGQPAGARATSTKPASGTAAQAPMVDQTPLLTAQRLVQMPTSPEEKPFDEKDQRIADTEMDLAFPAAVRDAEKNPTFLTAPAQAIEKHFLNAEKALWPDNARW